MREFLTPKQLARAVDVSESSIKRWCDKGVIPTQYTAGGHRRVARADVVAFLRSGKHQLIHPEALGLPPTSGQTTRVISRAREELVRSFLAGDEGRSRQLAIDLYLAQHSISVICDEMIAAAFREIGERWSCGEAEIYQERLGCEIALRLLHELRGVLRPASISAPLAIGGAAAGDQYNLGTTMAELVLRDVGWNAISMGDNLPFETMSAAIRQRRPKLFWLSCSYIANEDEFLAGYRDLYEECGMDVAIVIGGSAMNAAIRDQMKYAAFCDNMQRLESFAQSLFTAIGPEPPADQG